MKISCSFQQLREHRLEVPYCSHGQELLPFASDTSPLLTERRARAAACHLSQSMWWATEPEEHGRNIPRGCSLSENGTKEDALLVAGIHITSPIRPGPTGTGAYLLPSGDITKKWSGAYFACYRGISMYPFPRHKAFAHSLQFQTLICCPTSGSCTAGCWVGDKPVPPAGPSCWWGQILAEGLPCPHI